MKHNSSSQAGGFYEADVSVVLIPKCPKCSAANPQGLDNCPSCGVEAPMQRHQPVLNSAAVLNQMFPWHGRALLSIGAALKRFAKWIKGR